MEILTSHTKCRCRTLIFVAAMDMVIFNKVFLVGLFIIVALVVTP